MPNMFFERRNNDEEIKEVLEKDEIPYTYNCYASYSLHYNGEPKDDYFYFGFLASRNLLNAVEEFNKTFSNIKIVVIAEKKYEIGGDFYWRTHNIRRGAVHSYFMFRVELNKDYSIQANFWLNLAVAQFIRAFCPEYDFYRAAIEIKENYLEEILYIFNTISEYGNWVASKKTVHIDTLLKFDNINGMNRILESLELDEMPRLSQWIDKISNMDEE